MKKIKKFGKFMAAQYAIQVASVVAVSAQASQYVPDNGPVNKELVPFVQDLLNMAISMAALIAVGILIYSGILYITAAGDDGKIEKATKGITYAVVGLIIAFISIIIVNFVINDVLKAA
jgi:hypothetical protein